MMCNASELYEIADKKQAEIKAERKARAKEWVDGVVTEFFYSIAKEGGFMAIATAPKELDDCITEIHEYFESLGFKVTKDTRFSFRISWWRSQKNDEESLAK